MVEGLAAGEMVERVAKAICQEATGHAEVGISGSENFSRDQCLWMARAAISAMLGLTEAEWLAVSRAVLGGQ